MITFQFNRRISDSLIKRLIYQIEAFGHTVTASQVNIVFEKILKIEDGIEGRLAGDIEDYVLLYFSIQAAAMKLKGQKTKLLEIGVLFGASLIISRLALDDIGDKREIIGIDPLDGYYLHDDSGRSSQIDGATKLKIHKERVQKNLNTHACENIRIIQKLSQSSEARKILNQETLFYLFIDGDHTFDGFQKDLENYFPRLQIGGIVAIDNFYDNSWTDVTSVLSERRWFERLKPISFINRTLFCEKVRLPTKDFSFVREFNRKVGEILEFSNSKNQLHDHIKNQSNFINKSYNSLNEDVRKLRIENKSFMDAFKESIKSITSDAVNNLSADTIKLININNKSTNDIAKNVTKIGNLINKSNTQENNSTHKLLSEIESINDSIKNSSEREKASSNSLVKNISKIGNLINKSNTQENNSTHKLLSEIKNINDSIKNSSEREIASSNSLVKNISKIGDLVELSNTQGKDLSDNLLTKIGNLIEKSNTQESNSTNKLLTEIKNIDDSIKNSSEREKASSNSLVKNISKIGDLVELSNTQGKDLSDNLLTKIGTVHASVLDSSKQERETIDVLSKKLAEIDEQIKVRINKQNQTQIESHRDMLSSLSSFGNKMNQKLGSISDNGTLLIEDSTQMKISLQNLRSTISEIHNKFGEEKERRLANENVLLLKIASLEKYEALYMESHMLFRIKLFVKYGFIKWFSKNAKDKYNSLVSLNKALKNSIEIGSVQKE